MFELAVTRPLPCLDAMQNAQKYWGLNIVPLTHYFGAMKLQVDRYGDQLYRRGRQPRHFLLSCMHSQMECIWRCVSLISIIQIYICNSIVYSHDPNPPRISPLFSFRFIFKAFEFFHPNDAFRLTSSKFFTKRAFFTNIIGYSAHKHPRPTTKYLVGYRPNLTSLSVFNQFRFGKRSSSLL